MQAGERVEVNQVWAGCAPGYGKPLRHWFKGYEFVRPEGSRMVIMRATSGTYEGCEIRFEADCVRPEGGTL